MEYVSFDGIGLAELVQAGDVTPRELAEAALRAIDALDPKLSALLDVFRDDIAAMPQDAKASGTFGGVPMIIKDCVLMLEGKPVLNGSRLCEGMKAPHDTELMKRFRASGAVPVALSKCPEFGYNASTEPLASGPVHNPWQKGLSPGGSSGGSAAAVAAGYVPFAHGNDGGGSIRIPASACGLVGLKPTRGRNPLGPDFGEALFGMSCEGILSRTVRDTAHMLDCTNGPGVGDPYQIPLPDAPYGGDLERAPKGLRVAVSAVPPWAPAPDAAVSEAVMQTAHMLEAMGHKLAEDAPKFDAEQLSEAINAAWVVGETAWIKATAETSGRAPGPDTLERVMWNIYREGIKMNAPETIATVLGGFNACCRSIAPFFEQYDLLMTPTIATPPFAHGVLDQNADLTSREWWDHLMTIIPFTPVWNVTGQPAISLPLGITAKGLPIGVQFTARFGCEGILLRLARQLEDAMPWHARHPATSLWALAN
ncbi:amidase [uncultured Roseovarius sp.]|uniref:amidase n=1 Tax=uncultured Roseovarius sp. TaxID=293344 RepID=UPI002604A071|nr:amidase [uncultured Roseovarius sp.]